LCNPVILIRRNQISIFEQKVNPVFKKANSDRKLKTSFCSNAISNKKYSNFKYCKTSLNIKKEITDEEMDEDVFEDYIFEESFDRKLKFYDSFIKVRNFNF
jgi:hypothetical protein